MKTKIKKVEEIHEVETKYGILRESKSGHLLLANEDFKINIWTEDDATREIVINYRIHRPGHDHDNSPEIILEIPKDGVIMPDCGYTGKLKSQRAQLTIQSDSGYMMLETFAKEYVWHKRARFYIPAYCWKGEDQKQ